MDTMDDLRQKNLSDLRFETLLRPLARAGKVVLAEEPPWPPAPAFVLV